MGTRKEFKRQHLLKNLSCCQPYALGRQTSERGAFLFTQNHIQARWSCVTVLLCFLLGHRQ